MKAKKSRDFLSDYLRAYADSPGLALYRALEAREFAGEEFRMPVLDLGCGDGSFASVMFAGESRVRVSGLDSNLECLKQARSRSCYENVILGDIQSMGIKDRSFQTVFSNCVLEHVPDVNAALGEVGRIIKPGGAFFFTVPSEKYGDYLLFCRLLRRAGLAGRARRYFQKVTARLNHFHYYSPPSWEARLRHAGFEITRVCYYSSPSSHRVYDLLFNSPGIGKVRPVAVHYRIIHLADRLGLRFVRAGAVALFARFLKMYYDVDEPASRRGGGGLFIAARRK